MAIADAIESDIKQGRLAPGAQLPTHRELAEHLGVTVGTVTRGYAEAARRGLLRGETGRGTFVGGETHPALMCHREDTVPGVVDMSMTHPLEELSPDLADVLREIAASPDVNRLLEYFPSCGRAIDREVGAQWMERFNVAVSPDNVAVAVGGQNALAVVLSSMFNPGDMIATEGITYPLIKTLARRFHLKLVPVAQDGEGMIPESLDEVCRTHPVRGVYVMPTCQNPTTARMPEYRRQEIAEMAGKHDLLILEDDAYGLVSGNLGVPFVSLVPERTFFVASMSKSVAGGLRVCYLASPPQHTKAVKRALSDMVWMTPPLMAEIARRWILDGTADAILAAKQVEARRRASVARKELSGLDISVQKIGYYAWLRLPDPWTAGDFARAAEENDVLVTTDDIFTIGRTPPPHAVRLALSSESAWTDLRRGLRIIADILNP